MTFCDISLGSNTDLIKYSIDSTWAIRFMNNHNYNSADFQEWWDNVPIIICPLFIDNLQLLLQHMHSYHKLTNYSVENCHFRNPSFSATSGEVQSAGNRIRHKTSKNSSRYSCHISSTNIPQAANLRTFTNVE